MEPLVMERYDVAVIGTGPGGEGAAMQAAKRGRRVAVVERRAVVGGDCTHHGTIPSKALRHAVQRLTEFRNDPLLRDLIPEIPFPRLVDRAQGIVARQVQVRRTFYERNGVHLMTGTARLADEHTVSVTGPDGQVTSIVAEAIVLATGSRPYRPATVDFNHPRIVDSSSVLSLKSTPRSVTIYGAGVVGCEYASVFRLLRAKVNLVNTRDKLLAFLDDEIIDALAYHLRDQGILIRHGEECDRVEARDDGVLLHLRSGKLLKSDLLLWANGRTGNSDGLGLENLGITADERGQVSVDDCYRTAVPHIYAVGDLIGLPSLASAAYDQGRDAMLHLSGGTCTPRSQRMVPTGIYTSPEISSIGHTERELTAAKVPYEVGHALFRSMARAQITGLTTGMLKILFHRETLEILGIHCFGDQAAEIIHIGQAIMAQPVPGNSLRFFAGTTFNYPTMAEAYRIAALNGLNRVS
jgi:NAD(P) transhydrogenase